MRLRTGRRNRCNLYFQLGLEPSDNDPCVGFMLDEDDAEMIAEGLTSPWHLNELRMSAEDRETMPTLAEALIGPETQAIVQALIGPGEQGS